eukprot:TRINITY_DN136472_c0_g1_i1.p1 TRINITY_DN136472_c0_g1~~TRINITY_DN136472_c0_g1_i1.p1  ORF type:complete len:141 (+),score=26.89 TRINITY_DN136472_c0_g1_i1:94-516(+)
MVGKNSMMKIFGRVKGYPRLKTEQQWKALYERHKILLPGLTQLELFYSKKGPGQAGIRHFKAYKIPPIEYWNEGVDVKINLVDDPNPKIVLNYEAQAELKKIEIDCFKKREEEILKELLEIVPNSLSSPQPLKKTLYSHL